MNAFLYFLRNIFQQSFQRIEKFFLPIPIAKHFIDYKVLVWFVSFNGFQISLCFLSMRIDYIIPFALLRRSSPACFLSGCLLVSEDACKQGFPSEFNQVLLADRGRLTNRLHKSLWRRSLHLSCLLLVYTKIHNPRYMGDVLRKAFEMAWLMIALLKFFLQKEKTL